MNSRPARVADRAAGPVPGRTSTVARRGTAGVLLFRGTANLVYAAILLLGGLAPSLPDISRAVSDTTLHGVAYLIQTLLLFWFARAFLATVPALVSAALGAVAYSTLVELCQLLQPARSFEGRDLAANFTGVVVACAVALIASASSRRW